MTKPPIVVEHEEGTVQVDTDAWKHGPVTTRHVEREEDLEKVVKPQDHPPVNPSK